MDKVLGKPAVENFHLDCKIQNIFTLSFYKFYLSSCYLASYLAFYNFKWKILMYILLPFRNTEFVYFSCDLLYALH